MASLSSSGGLGGGLDMGSLGGAGSSQTAVEGGKGLDIMEIAAKAAMSENHAASVGPYIIGFVFDLMLFGVLLAMTVSWAQNFRLERWLVRMITVVVVSVATGTTCYIFWYIFTLFVINYSTYASFLDPGKMGFFAIVDACTTIPVQLFYLERGYRLFNKQWWIVALISPFIVSSMIGAIGVKVGGDNLDSFLEAEKIRKWFYLWLGSVAAADLLLTSTIAWGLARTRTGFRTTDQLIYRLIRVSVETQLPCTLSAVVLMLNFGIDSRSFLNIMWELSHAKLYAVTLLACLNYRFVLRRDISTNPSTNRLSGMTGNASFGSRKHQRTMLDVELDKIRVHTATAEQTFDVVERLPGLNRRRIDEEEYGTTSIELQRGDPTSRREGTWAEEEYGSTTRLT